MQVLNKRQEYSRMRSKAISECKTERVKECRIKSLGEIKELVHTKTEEALQLAVKEHDLWMYQNEKEEAKRLQDARKPRKDGEMAWGTTKNELEWPRWEEATKTAESEWRLEPEGEAEVTEISIVSDAVEGTFVDMDGESRHEQVEVKLSRRGREIEEEEERIFVPSAVSVPLKPLFRCDNQCSEKTLSYLHLASVVLNEGDEAYTTNLCQKCFNNTCRQE